MIFVVVFKYVISIYKMSSKYDLEVSYMNNNQTTAHARYEAHVKDALLTGKPVKFDLKDFQGGKNHSEKKRKKARQKTKYESIVFDAFKKGKELFPRMEEDMVVRHSYINSIIMEEMTKCESIDETRQLYDTFVNITYHTPVTKY